MTLIFFYDKNRPDGFCDWCKKCAGYKYKPVYHPIEDKDGIRTCATCHEQLPLMEEFFNKNNHNVGGLSRRCKNCTRIAGTNNRRKKSEYYNAKGRKWSHDHKDELWAKKKERMRTDINYKIAINTKDRILSAIKKGGGKKQCKTIELLGCTYSEFKIYFENLFTEEMSWDLFMAGIITIDHIRPLASFDLVDIEQQKIAFHYSNTRPMFFNDNAAKNSFWEGKRWLYPKQIPIL